MTMVTTKACDRCDGPAYWLRIDGDIPSTFCQFHGPMEHNFGRRDEVVIWRLA